jgi:hypothetical protein
MRLASDPGSRAAGAWVGATLIGTLLGAAFTLTLTPVMEDWVRFHWTLWPSLGGGDFAARAGSAFVSGTALAAPQAFVLGRRLGRIEIAWLAASVAAAVVAFTIPFGTLLYSSGRIGDLPGQAVQPSLVLYPLVYGVSAGAIYGAAQTIVLWRYVRGAKWWLLASTLAYGLAGPATALVNWEIAGAGTRPTPLAVFYWEAAAGSLIHGLIVGLVTGLALVHLLMKSETRTATAATLGPRSPAEHIT